MSKNKIPESKLIKALAELEGGVTKGDPLEDADPEGGLSTEGDPLSDAAPKGRDARKSRTGPDESSSPGSSASSSDSQDSDSDDDGDDDDEPPPPPKKLKKSAEDRKKSGKKGAIAKMAYSMSTSDDSDDESSDDGDDAEKSFRDRAEGDETMRKAMVVNDFLESMIDNLSTELRNMSRSIKKSFDAMEQRLGALIDDRVSKSASSQHDFNVRLARATAAIGNTIQGDVLGMVDIVKSLAHQPVSPRGKAVLSKGEVNQPPWGGSLTVNSDQRLANGSDDYVEALKQIGREKISDWLFRKSANQQLDPNVILAWEADRYDPATLPSMVRKSIVDDLVK